MALGGSYQDFHLEQYKDGLDHELQQKGSVLMQAVTVENVEGEKSYFHKTGKATSKRKQQRGELKQFNDRSYERRELNNEFITSDELMDRVDLLNMIRNPQNEITQSMVMEIGRQEDDVIFRAISGNAIVIENGASSNVVLPSTSKVAVNSHAFDQNGGTNDIALTPSKLKEALKILGESYVDVTREDVFVVGSANQFMKLATFDEVVNHDYRMKKPLDGPGLIQGGIQGYLGLNFIQYEETDLVGTDETVYVFPKSAIKLGIRQPLKVEVGPDYSRVGNPDVLSATIDLGAVRMYEEKVIQIACDPNVVKPA